jgi:hypothetical protein
MELLVIKYFIITLFILYVIKLDIILILFILIKLTRLYEVNDEESDIFNLSISNPNITQHEEVGFINGITCYQILHHHLKLCIYICKLIYMYIFTK